MTPGLAAHSIVYVPETIRICRNRPVLPARAPWVVPHAPMPDARMQRALLQRAPVRRALVQRAAMQQALVRQAVMPQAPGLQVPGRRTTLTKRRAVDFCRVATAICWQDISQQA